MQTITVKTDVYKFNELSDETKEHCIEQMYDMNVDYDWWESVCYDAEQIGLKITGFNLDRGSYCSGDFIEYANEVAELIIKNHGKMCETYKTAQDYLTEYNKLTKDSLLCVECEEKAECLGDDDIDTDDIDAEFQKSLLEDYRIILQKEYDYLTSEEAIIETIECNDYNFTIDGKLF